MPAVTFNLYDKFRENNFNGGAVDIDTATLKIAILKIGYTPNQNTDAVATSLGLGTNEVTGTGYTARGNICATGTVTLDGAGLVTIDAADPATWTQDASGFSDGRYAVLYDDTGTDSTSKLIGFSNDFGSDQGNVNGNFFVSFNAAGIFTSAR